MRIGIIGGTNADYSFPWTEDRTVETRFGSVEVSLAPVGDAEIVFVRRHGRRHELLSSAVNHRANIAALNELGVDAIVGTTVCGVIDGDLPLGTPIVFDDLLFADNRLPDGSPCTFFETPGEPGRGHYIFGSPFSSGVRFALLAAAETAGLAARDGGVYAYALGPRFNTKTEIRWFGSLGATAVSQTAGPEAILAGELEIPFALLGFGVDYANGVKDEPTPVEVLNENVGLSKRAFQSIVEGAVELLAEPTFDQGFVYRFE